MKTKLTRREFLQLSMLSALSVAGPRLPQLASSQPNILIVVLDALSAENMSLYGYPRPTTPNLTRLAEKAIVYHNHYSAGNFTTPGTASLLTGVYPWTHRAVTHNGQVREIFVNQNLFALFPNHQRFAYTHNVLANTLLRQFLPSIDSYLPRENLYLTGNQTFAKLFQSDEDISSLSLIRALKQSKTGHSYSLFFPALYEKITQIRIAEYAKDFPLGLPNINVDDYFLMEHAVDYWARQLKKLPQPFLGYLHFLPPHAPYNTRKEFAKNFAADGLAPNEKPRHIFSRSRSQAELNQKRTAYDEFILYADAEFARFFNALDASGILENTWVILTSDHGELFERGVLGHKTPLMHQPLLHIPLLIFEPGRTSRKDIYTNTNSVDIVPTLAQIGGHPQPGWVAGQPLPGIAGANPNEDRLIFSLEAKDPKGGPILKGAATMIEKTNKLMYYFGYQQLGEAKEFVELYNLKDDPQEIHNQYAAQPGLGQAMLATLKEKIRQANLPYQ